MQKFVRGNDSQNLRRHMVAPSFFTSFNRGKAPLDLLLNGRGGGGLIYYAKSEMLDFESNLVFLGGGGVIYYRQLEGNLLCEIRSA